MDKTRYTRADITTAKRIAYLTVASELRQTAKLFRQWCDASGNVGIKDAYNACAMEMDCLVTRYQEREANA